MFRSSRPHSLPAHSRSASLRRFDLRTFRPSDLPTFHNSFLFRTSAKPGRKPFSICTSVALPDLRIPKDLRRLATPLFSALAGTSHKCGKQTTYNPCRICTYEKCARNSFRIRTYKNTGGRGFRGSFVRCQFSARTAPHLNTKQSQQLGSLLTAHYSRSVMEQIARSHVFTHINATVRY